MPLTQANGQGLEHLAGVHFAETSQDENENIKKRSRRAGRKHRNNNYQNSDETLKSDKDSLQKYKTEL